MSPLRVRIKVEVLGSGFLGFRAWGSGFRAWVGLGVRR